MPGVRRRTLHEAEAAAGIGSNLPCRSFPIAVSHFPHGVVIAFAAIGSLAAFPESLRVARRPVHGLQGGAARSGTHGFRPEVYPELAGVLYACGQGEQLVEKGVGVGLGLASLHQFEPYVVVALPVGLHLHPEVRRVALLVLGEVEREVVV